MARYVITTVPGRRTRRVRNDRTKYAKVRTDGKFTFVTSPDEATQFDSFGKLLQAFGRRCRALRSNPTDQLTVAKVRPAGVAVEEVLNGR